LRILGSNFILKDRNLLFSTKKPFFYITEKGLLEDKLRFCDEIRSFFKDQVLI